MRSRLHGADNGTVLVVTLVLLVCLLLGAAVLARSVNTANLISGNLSFKTASLHLADVATEKAISDLPNVTTLYARCVMAPYVAGCRYSPTILDADDTGIPTSVDWTRIQGIDEQLSGYTARYLIERLCRDTTLDRCLAESEVGNDSKTPDAVPVPGPRKIFYRVTVRVEGPRSTRTFTQVVLSY
ncbi:MAG: hypothetical protein V7606_1152 [Burkholderiales bacterium]